MSMESEVREQQRQSWDQVSGGWEEWDHLLVPMMSPVGDEMVKMLGVADGTDHLDVACGTGEPGLSIAAIASSGRVVLTDLASGMLDVARRKAGDRGITNVEFRVCSADDLPFADESFDTISCRFGFMYFPDLSKAATELRRVMRPGGRLCVSVWAEREDNPWATIPMEAISTEIDMPTPSADTPGIFRNSALGAISALFESAGLNNAVEAEVHSNLIAESADEYWQYMIDVGAPLAGALAQVDEPARRRISAIAINKADQYQGDARLQIPALARCIVATR